MSNLSKFLKKLLPRIGAVAAAAAVGFALYAAGLYYLFVPENNSTVPFDTTPVGEGEQPSFDVSEKEFNFLVMGHDRAANLTDVIMIINYNTDTQKISIMQIPRDTYFEVGTYSYHKINGVYNMFIEEARENGSNDPEMDGCRAVADFFEQNLCLKIQYATVMDLNGFSNIVDAIGGVYMYVPMDMYYEDSEQDLLINLREGYQTLNGDTAEQFVRFRYGYANGDIGRGNAQKLFISAFINQLKEKVSITDVGLISSLASNVITYVKTDMTVGDIIYFGKSFIGIDKESGVELSNVTMMTMPGEAVNYDASYYIMNKEATAKIINERFNIYDFDITSSFDKSMTFVEEDISNIYAVYNTPAEDLNYEIYNADDLEENGLD